MADDKGAGTVPNGKRANVWPGKGGLLRRKDGAGWVGACGMTGGAVIGLYSSSLSTARKASVGIWTEPRERIFFLPSFCFSSSFFFRVMSPP